MKYRLMMLGAAAAMALGGSLGGTSTASADCVVTVSPCSGRCTVNAPMGYCSGHCTVNGPYAYCGPNCYTTANLGYCP